MQIRSQILGMHRCLSCDGILTDSGGGCFSCGKRVAKRSESAGNGMSVVVPLAVIALLALAAWIPLS